MADVELIIKIPEETYEYWKTHSYEYVIGEAIAKGTPLPKGHGRLIDADDIRVIELEDSLHFIRHKKGDDIDVYIDASTIIEADKESEK